MKIYLIRHGKTYYNEVGKYLGVSDVNLSKNGVLELKKISYKFKYDVIISSPLKRCIQTSKILFKNHDYIIDDFKEFNFGRFEGFTYEQLKEDLEYQLWLEDIDNYKISNGQSSQEFKKIVLGAYENILKMNYECVVIVCHAGVIRALVEHFTNKNFFEISVDYGRGYVIENGEVKKI
ncbi:MAG: histidine phosphatase family protein [Bacilli bacterium]